MPQFIIKYTERTHETVEYTAVDTADAMAQFAMLKDHVETEYPHVTIEFVECIDKGYEKTGE